MPDPAAPDRPPTDRRRHPRIAILEQLHGQFVSIDVPVQTLDIGPGGFAISSPVAFPVDEVHEFLLTRDDGVSLLVTARVTHCEAATAPDETGRYVAGFAFAREDERTHRAVAALLHYLESLPDTL
ncbi:MAG TPA: PilZ domain-containing protein [Vicinamibacterales bacterium]|nr:PilZ domain-containing protein [Vicinamibacterales bacterium]